MANNMQRWIYKIVRVKFGTFRFNPDAAEDQMNKLGRDGWELVSTYQAYGESGPTLFFKRPA